VALPAQSVAERRRRHSQSHQKEGRTMVRKVRMRFWFMLAVSLAGLFVAASLYKNAAIAQDTSKPERPKTKWEYKVVPAGNDSEKMEETLNKLGEDGWEYVGTVAWVGGPRGGVVPGPNFMICKRPKP
jgi:hypothetical protein